MIAALGEAQVGASSSTPTERRLKELHQAGMYKPPNASSSTPTERRLKGTVKDQNRLGDFASSSTPTERRLKVGNDAHARKVRRSFLIHSDRAETESTLAGEHAVTVEVLPHPLRQSGD